MKKMYPLEIEQKRLFQISLDQLRLDQISLEQTSFDLTRLKKTKIDYKEPLHAIYTVKKLNHMDQQTKTEEEE